MIDQRFITAEYRRAGIDLEHLGVTVEHYRGEDGTLRAGIDFDGWLIVAQVFSAGAARRCACPRPLLDAGTCTKCGRPT